jgi:FAD/FMN-containing dehydrogenase
MASTIASPHTQVILAALGGAVARTDRGSMALDVPDAPWMYFYLAMWWEEGDTDQEVSAARSFVERMRQWAVGQASLPNFISADDGEARLRAAYGEEKFGRLVALKDQYDPDNVFSLNQNIPPSLPEA